MRATASDETPPQDPSPRDVAMVSQAAHPRPARALVALCLVPPLLLAWLVWRFGVDVPLLDQWSLAYDLERFLDGTWTPTEVLRAHNGHRIALPRLLLVPLATATGWNVRVEMALGLAVGATIFLLVAGATRDLARTVSATGRAVFLFFASVLVFSLAQYENWLWGIQLQALLAVAFSLAGLAALRADRIGATELGLGLLAGVGAALSQATGLVYFVAAAGVLALPRPRDGGLPVALRAGPWLVLSIAACWLYARPLPGDAALPLQLELLAEPGRLAYFVTSLLGAGIAGFAGAAWPPRDDGVGWAIGLAGLVAAAGLAQPHLRRGAPPAPWFRFLAGAAAFSVGCAVAAGVARGGGGAPAAFASRYLVLSAPFWIFVAALAIERACPLRATAPRGGRLARIGVALLVACALASSLGALGAYAARETELAPARRALAAGAPEALLARLHPELQQVRDGRAALERRGLSVFRAAAGGAPAAGAPPARLGTMSQRLAWSAAPPMRFAARGITAAAVSVENTGPEPWPSLGADAAATGRVDLAFRFVDPATGAIAAEGVAAELPHDVAPGERIDLAACLAPPETAGRYRLRLSFVQQRIAWFDDLGSPGLALEVEVAPTTWRTRAEATLRRLLAWLGGPAC